MSSRPGEGDSPDEAAEGRKGLPQALPRPLAAPLKSVLAAGLVAGLASGLFHLFVSEPVVDLAISLEGTGLAGQGPELVSREAQKAGLIVALALYGLVWAALLAATIRLLRLVSVRQVIGAVAVLAWATAIFPFLKYPASPPGVGDPDSLVFRQALYLLCLGIAAVGAGGAYALAKKVGVRWAVAAYVSLLGITFLALPDNPDPVHVPADLLSTFRAFSLAGLLVFWAAFALVLATLLGRSREQA